MRQRLIGAAGITVNGADRLLAEWEAEAASRGIDRDNRDFWREGTR